MIELVSHKSITPLLVSVYTSQFFSIKISNNKPSFCKQIAYLPIKNSLTRGVGDSSLYIVSLYINI